MGEEVHGVYDAPQILRDAKLFTCTTPGERGALKKRLRLRVKVFLCTFEAEAESESTSEFLASSCSRT